MTVKFSNNASALLDGAITNSATSITLDDVSEFPTLSGTDYTYLTLSNAAATTSEIIKVTAINTSTKVLTAVRAQDSTSASAFADGDICELRITSALLTDISTEAAGDRGVAMSIALGQELKMANTFKLKTKAGIDASLVTVYTVPSATTTVIIGLTIANIKGASVTADVKIISDTSDTETNADVYIVKDIPLPAGSSVEVMAGNKIVLKATDAIQVKGSVADAVDATLSIMEITA